MRKCCYLLVSTTRHPLLILGHLPLRLGHLLDLVIQTCKFFESRCAFSFPSSRGSVRGRMFVFNYVCTDVRKQIKYHARALESHSKFRGVVCTLPDANPQKCSQPPYEDTQASGIYSLQLHGRILMRQALRVQLYNMAWVACRLRHPTTKYGDKNRMPLMCSCGLTWP